METFEKLDFERILEKTDVPSLEKSVIVLNDLNLIPKFEGARKCNHLIIGICTSGKIRCKIDQKDLVVNHNEAFIIVQGQIIEDVWMSNDFQGFGFIIEYSFLYEIVKDVHNLSALFLLARRHPVFSIMYREVTAAKEYVELIKHKLTGPKFKYQNDVIRLLLLTLIYDMGSAFYRVMNEDQTQMRNTKAERVFVHFIQLVEHHHCKERRVSWYAEKIGITPKYLSEIVSSVSKRSPNDWIDKYVTTEIRNQLRHTDKKISEIAQELNFQNQSFMGKYFRENVGVSPTEYRRGKEI